MNANEIIIYLSFINDGDWDKTFNDIRSKRRDFSNEDVQNVLKNIKSKFITLLDKEYPETLKNSYKPPLALYYYGDISLLKEYEKSVCVIGSRNPSSYGIEMTEKIVNDLPNDIVIVSGLANGIDVTSHKAAINTNHKTIAVIGSGIDNCYPSENQRVYEEIKENHLLLSEYPNMVKPDKDHFPMRNRILAALSKTVVVTDASYRSGSSITVSFAIEGGKNVCCIPHKATEQSLCNKLIKEGARLIENGDEILEEINYKQYN